MNLTFEEEGNREEKEEITPALFLNQEAYAKLSFMFDLVSHVEIFYKPSHIMRGSFSTVVMVRVDASEGDEARGIVLPQCKLSGE